MLPQYRTCEVAKSTRIRGLRLLSMTRLCCSSFQAMLLAVVITRPCAAGKTQDELDAWAGERIECSVRVEDDCEPP